MQQNWKTYKLGDLIEVNSNSLRKGEIEWINYVDIKSAGTGLYEEPKKLMFKDAPSRARRLLQEGDTVISSVRPNLKSFFYSQNLRENTVASTGFAVLTPKNIDSRFLYYLTTNDSYIDFLVNSCTGSAYPAFGPNVLINSKVTIPETRQEQKSIASILSALDDKIELNLQMNKTLEEMAMAFYKHWFVDFGPFQSGELVDSELGMIPKGWEVKNLGELGKIYYGKMPKKERLIAKGYPVYSGYRNVGYYPEYNCEIGKVIVVARGVGGTGDVKLTSEKCFLTNLSICLENTLEYIDDSLLFFGLKRNGLDYLRTGSAQPQITINDLNKVATLIPNKDIQFQFLKLFNSLTQAIESNSHENKILTKLRDTLLPKLISGEVRVKDIEQTIAQVL